MADALSKFRDTDDWSIDDETFKYIRTSFGKFDIDRFASLTNRKTKRFDARFYCTEAESINAFTIDWGRDFCGDSLFYFSKRRRRSVFTTPVYA